MLAAAAYIYVVLLAIWAYRLLFGYSKWAFPTMELKENAKSANSHRLFWYAIVVGLIVNFIWEILS